MERDHLIGILLAVVALAIGVWAAFFVGEGPLPGGDDSGTTSGFSFAVDSIENCGRTCQDLTVTLDNDGADAASQLTLHTRIFAGKNNTAESDLVWEDTLAVGTLEPGGSYTTTERVEFSFREGQKITDEDGWVTIRTTVESTETEITFERSRQITITVVMSGTDQNASRLSACSYHAQP